MLPIPTARPTVRTWIASHSLLLDLSKALEPPLSSGTDISPYGVSAFFVMYPFPSCADGHETLSDGRQGHREVS